MSAKQNVVRKAAGAFALAFYLTLGALLPARADGERALPIEELAQQAALILEGRVISTTCEQDDAGRIFTAIEFEVQEVWKGNWTTSLIRLVHSGGVLGDQIATTSGEVNFEPGETTVVFLVMNQRGEGVTLGMRQGKFSLQTDATSGAVLAHNPYHGQPNGVSGLRRHSADANGLTVDALKQRVQESLL